MGYSKKHVIAHLQNSDEKQASKARLSKDINSLRPE
jgi:hypothetical protein